MVARAGGVPLFVEEVTRLLLESGDRGGSHDIPSTLRASLMARLDRMGPAKEVAQIGAVLGREFGWPLIKAMTALPDEPLRTALERLVDADLVQAEGLPPETRYRFKHALIQDAAYEALLKGRRRDLHRLAAQVLPTHDGALAESHPELLAHHLTEAGENEAAASAWRRAADAAMADNALAEAARHYRRALDVLMLLPDTPDRAAQEFTLRMNLAHAVRALKGLSAAETFSAYQEALSLGERLGNIAAITPVLAGLTSATYVGARFDAALALGDRLAALAPLGGGRLAEGYAKLTRGVVCLWTGKLAEAVLALDSAIAVAAQGDHIGLAGIDLGVVARNYRVFALALSGRLDAVQEDTLWLAREGEASGRLANRGMAFIGAAFGATFRDDVVNILAYGEMLRAIGRESQMGLYSAVGEFHSGIALVKQGRAREGAALVDRATAAMLTQGILSFRPYHLGRLAEARAAAGDWDGALAAVDEGIAPGASPTTVLGPDLRRIRTDVILQKAAAGSGATADLVGEAARDFRTALAEARTTGARLLELRAASGLARLLREQGDHAAARDVLAPIYGRFAEGLDTPPLLEAATMLRELGWDDRRGCE